MRKSIVTKHIGTRGWGIALRAAEKKRENRSPRMYEQQFFRSQNRTAANTTPMVFFPKRGR